MIYLNRTSNTRDVESPAETVLSSHSLLRSAIENLDRDKRKSVTFQHNETTSFDSFTEKKK